MKRDYWKKYWNENPAIHSGSPQQQVTRTKNKVPIEDGLWDYTLAGIEKALELRSEDTLLDLGAGNGLVSVPFSRKCRAVVAVDISSALAGRIDTSAHRNISVVVGDIMDLEFGENSFTKGIMYSVLQHFSERDTVRIFEHIHRWLVPGGIFFIGDIPDVDCLWDFFDTPEREKAYFDSIRHESPVVGTWFKRSFLYKLACSAGFSKCEVLDQDPALFNAHYRFDLKLVK